MDHGQKYDDGPYAEAQFGNFGAHLDALPHDRYEVECLSPVGGYALLEDRNALSEGNYTLSKGKYTLSEELYTLSEELSEEQYALSEEQYAKPDGAV